MPFSIEAAKEAIKTEAAIGYEFYRICKNAIQADDGMLHFAALLKSPPTFTPNGDAKLEEEFGVPHFSTESLLHSENFRIDYVIPEYRISPQERVDLLITAEEYKSRKPFLLIECKRRPFQKPGPSYAMAIRRQAIRYSRSLQLRHYAVFDGWVMILGTTSFPFLLGIFDAEIGKTLTPTLLRDLLHAVHELEGNDIKALESLKRISIPRDPESLSRQVLPFVAKELARNEKDGLWAGETEQGRIDYIVKKWRKELLFL